MGQIGQIEPRLCPITHFGGIDKKGVSGEIEELLFEADIPDFPHRAYRRKQPKGVWGGPSPSRPQNIVLSIFTRGIESLVNRD
jgi:hypothetical protein